MSNRRNICVVVLGDIGRSPRMQYHCQSLIEENFNVHLIGYVETVPLAVITSSPYAQIHKLHSVPEIPFPSIIKYIFKTLWQLLTLFLTLISIPKPEIVLIQNPPAVPTFFVCYLYCLITRSKFVIDWHNYTHTIFAINSNPNGILVKLIKWMETFFGKKSIANFCVTKAMQTDLNNKWNIKATILYDRPPLHFATVTMEQKHNLFMKLSKDYSELLPKDCGDFKERGVMESTACTQKFRNGEIIYKKNRPGILVSSTSWTPDEDFNVLLTALEKYEESANTKSYPPLICIITGKGPQKDFYSQRISELKLKNVSMITVWLETEDYPVLLGSADLGVCLHWSSSGLDLPMKVVDMFGCGLPVCAINFECLNELVKHKENGFIFDNSDDLTEQLKKWFIEFPDNPHLLDVKKTFQKNLEQFQQLRWRENWKLHALPLLNSL